MQSINNELQREMEFLFEAPADTDNSVFEITDDRDSESETEPERNDYSDRLYEISARESESVDRDSGLNNVLDDMEQEYFFGSLKKKLKKAGKGLIKKGLGTVTKLASGNLKGLLKTAATTALNSFIPGSGVVAGPALTALGLEISGESEISRESWENFSNKCRESFETLSDLVVNAQNEDIQNPSAAARMATRAFDAAVNRRSRDTKTNGQRKITLHKGDSIIIQVI